MMPAYARRHLAVYLLGGDEGNVRALSATTGNLYQRRVGTKSLSFVKKKLMVDQFFLHKKIKWHWNIPCKEMVPPAVPVDVTLPTTGFTVSEVYLKYVKPTKRHGTKDVIE